MNEQSTNDDWIGRLFLVGLFAAGLLSASVSAILRRAKQCADATAPMGDTTGARP